MALFCLCCACGTAAPTEHEIFYTPELRPGTELAVNDAERALLERLPSAVDLAELSVAGQSFQLEPTYAAASGRRCRRVHSDHLRLVCEDAAGQWVFVPDPFGEPAEATRADSVEAPALEPDRASDGSVE